MKELFEKRKEIITALLLWCGVFVAYLVTMSRSVGFIDSGELATDVITIGVAHPTGYPLFTLIGRIFSILPIANEEIVRLNIQAAFFTSLAAAIFFFFLLEMFADGKYQDRNKKIIAAGIASIALAFSRTFWFQGLAIEVYSLHLLLISSVLFLFVRAVNTGESRWWLLFSFTVGLSFTNHLTTILLAPALIFWFFAEHGITKVAWKRIGILSIPFLTGLSLYAYLPIRALQQPLLNWGNPQTLEKFWWHFTGKQFSVFMFSSVEAASKQLNYFINNLSNEYFILFLILAAGGFFILLFVDRRKFIAVTLLFVSCVAYSINYDIHDIDSYFLLAFMAIAIFVSFSILQLLRWYKNPLAYSFVILALTAGLVVQANDHRSEVDQHENYLVEDYTKNILENLPRNSLVLSYQWDYLVASSYYYQHVKNIRPDVMILDKELFRRSWYTVQLESMYPQVMAGSKVQLESFRKELYKFEHGLPYDFSAIEGTYASLLKSILQNNGMSALYVTPEIEPQYTAGFHRIPEGFLFRLTKDTAYVSVPFPAIRYRDFSESDAYTQQIKSLMMNGLLRRSGYEHHYGYDSLAELYRQKAAEIHPNQ